MKLSISAVIENKTAKGRVIEYFLSPLLRYRQESVRERKFKLIYRVIASLFTVCYIVITLGCSAEYCEALDSHDGWIVDRCSKISSMESKYQVLLAKKLHEKGEEHHKTAFKVMKAAAKAGNAEAMFYVGWMYEDGMGVTTDIQSSLHYFKKSESLNFSKASLAIGNLYMSGKISGSPEYQQATAYFIKTARSGEVLGVHMAAMAYQANDNFLHAYVWAKLAAMPPGGEKSHWPETMKEIASKLSEEEFIEAENIYRQQNSYLKSELNFNS